MVVAIDGAYGEGGGQIIRSALALSIITGKPCRISNVRAGRKKPGLQNQHLVAVRAARRIGQGKMSGDELGSTKLEFEPGVLQTGEYHFPIGTAGSTSLVLQTILPPLMFAEGASKIVLEGGTHNPMAPPFDFLMHTFVPLIERIGPKVSLQLERYGFYPKGGGRVVANIEPSSNPTPLHIEQRGEIRSIGAEILLVNLPSHIAEREERVLREKMSRLSRVNVVQSTASPGAGNMIAVHVDSDFVRETITALGEQGLRAERLAESAAESVRAYVDSGAPVGEHLADQLLLPLAIGAGGSYITGALTEHTRTNIHVIKQFLDVSIDVDDLGQSLFRIRIARQ